MNKFQRYLVGTLFDEEQQQKKTNLSNMKAKDPFGNTRWKGAFTGGFEAGYKNTCGSKDGWTPSHFVSSVYKKAESNERTIFDYMDKEDLGRESISQNIVLNNNFESKKSQGFNITLQQSIGEKILNKLKKMQAHRLAPQSSEQLGKLFQLYAKEDEKEVPVYHMIDLLQPISVGSIARDIEQDDFIDSYEDLYKKVIRQHAKEESQEQINKRREQNRVYFDFTKPLDNQPQYLKEIHEIQEIQKPKKRQKNLINQQTLKNIYKPAVIFKQFKKEDEEIEKAPQDYDPLARMRGLQMIGQPKAQQSSRPKFLTADKRGQKLGETKLSDRFVSSQNSIANKFMSVEKKVEELVKFFEDEKKNKRYKEYVQEMEGRKISSQLEYMSYEQSQRQREEFQTMYKKYKANPPQVKQTEAAKIAIEQKKQVDTFRIIRRVQPWRPEKLLCKRFNVLTPYTISKDRERSMEEQYY